MMLEYIASKIGNGPSKPAAATPIVAPTSSAVMRRTSAPFAGASRRAPGSTLIAGTVSSRWKPSAEAIRIEWTRGARTNEQPALDAGRVDLTDRS